MPRKLGHVTHEANRAALALAGLRMILQSSISALSGADTTYTLTGTNTRRCIVIHLGAGAGDIRFDYNAAAIATDFPFLPQRYFSVDAKAGDVLHFYNTTASAITVYVMEVE